MSTKLILLLLVTLAFTVLTVIALLDVGYVGIFEPNFQAWGAAQVFFDLVILAALSCIWMVKDARAAKRNPWPYVVLTFAAGCFGVLIYLIVGELLAGKQDQKAVAQEVR
jgi:hypothetical protein